ncbi:MAG: DUF134 domain-containing protein [Lachnospiraceae bacterium]|nr:DUF134 domain-containing protein [Lachnospiraceae bacterium]
MPRNAKCRRVCGEFERTVFAPKDGVAEYVTISVDELEALRLCDFEGMDQEDAAKRMEVSRGTFQRILYAARSKSAEALCEGKGIVIEGGNYVVATTPCDCETVCKKCRLNKKCNKGE